MTENLDPTPRHSQRHPSSADIAVMKERIRQSDARDIVMSTQLDIIIGKLSKMETGMAIGERRMNEIDKHLESTDTDLEALKKSVEDDKRSPVAIIMATLSAIGAGAVAVFK